MGIDTWKLNLRLFSYACGVLLYFAIQAFVGLTHIDSQRKKVAMKNLSLQSVKKNQFQKWRKRIASTESAITLGNVKNQASFGCCCGSYVLRQLVWKFRIKWKQALGWRRSSGVRYTYDIHSYSLNFDDGLHHGHLPSRGSQWKFSPSQQQVTWLLSVGFVGQGGIYTRLSQDTGGIYFYQSVTGYFALLWEL